MAKYVRNAQLRAWRQAAMDGFVSGLETAPDATVPAYPSWTVRDLAVHVLEVTTRATTAAIQGTTERPDVELTVSASDDPATLAGALRQACDGAEDAVGNASHDRVWTPVGPRPPRFWSLRLLREFVLHRWDAEQAGGGVDLPPEQPAELLIDEFLETDLARVLAAGDHERGGRIRLSWGARERSVDLRTATSRGQPAGEPTASISGAPARIWLWLMRRDAAPPRIDDADGSIRAFAGLIDGLSRPAR